jgi:hypothetical protein
MRTDAKCSISSLVSTGTVMSATDGAFDAAKRPLARVSYGSGPPTGGRCSGGSWDSRLLNSCAQNVQGKAGTVPVKLGNWMRRRWHMYVVLWCKQCAVV